ncbi:MAG: deoxyguanosinetriphosphate triphosphohydrolase family protein [Rickettsiales bacterium]|nr:deoxyguanosinetriphosphate triphosphohydrolase family protein [Rickettsiales bacterium]
MTTANVKNITLASYACKPETSRGRLYPEAESNTRSAYQRDRDRIIHSTAFRRLEYKTQVFVNHEGDHYRNRLTHSLEVSQLARSTCRALGLNEDLAEALALAHDLGHTPFGHAGEDALSEVMEAFGGFDHNAHTLRILTSLEHRYAEFDGLNLTWETLEGVAKHNGPLIRPNASPILKMWKNFTGNLKSAGKNATAEDIHGGPPSARGEVRIGVARKTASQARVASAASPGLPRAIAEYNAKHDLELDTYASGEAQVASLCDDIAYNNHDIDDGLRAGLFTLEQLEQIDAVSRILNDVRRAYPHIDQQRLIHEMTRRIINRMVTDLIEQSTKNIKNFNIEKPEDIRKLNKPLIEFSPEMQEVNLQLKEFLMINMYRHYKVNRMASKARRVVKDLFNFYISEPNCLPNGWRELAGGVKTAKTGMVVADFIAGMTDRFALDEHQRIFDVRARSWIDK